MRNKLIITGVVTCLAAAPALAESSKQEAVGVGGGAVVGALAGGPVGLIIGAAIGAKLGDNYHRKDVEVASLSSSLQDSQLRVAELEGDVDSLNSEIDELSAALTEMQVHARPELLELLKAGIEMDLLFRTDEHVLADSTGNRLGHLAGKLATMPDVQVRVDGFADSRGAADYNQALSERRARHVADLLAANGIAESRIEVRAHGESPAADENIDSLALERKVSVTLYVDQSPAIASTNR